MSCEVPPFHPTPDRKCERTECEARCRKGNEGAACVALAGFDADVFVETEPHVFSRRVNAPVAFELYARACALGHERACFLAATTIGYDEARVGEVRALLDRGCRLGSPRSCDLLASGLLSGRFGPVSPARRACGTALYDRLCALRAWHACVDRAEVEPDPARKLAILSAACRPEDHKTTPTDFDACAALIELEWSMGRKADAKRDTGRVCTCTRAPGYCAQACALSIESACPEGLERLDRP